MRRTDYCGLMTEADIGKEAVACGWVANKEIWEELFLSTWLITPVSCRLFLIHKTLTKLLSTG